MQALFEGSFNKKIVFAKNSPESQVQENFKKIDALIKKNAPAWPINQIAPVDLAILRMATWELLYKKEKEPYKVVVDEAIEIAKEFGADTAATFINGVLGAIIKASKNINKNAGFPKL